LRLNIGGPAMKKYKNAKKKFDFKQYEAVVTAS